MVDANTTNTFKYVICSTEIEFIDIDLYKTIRNHEKPKDTIQNKKSALIK